MVGMDDVWTAQVLSGAAGDYRWPHGTRALIAERKKVQEMHGLHVALTYGQVGNPYTDERIFTFPVSFEEAFVGSDADRIMLTDRLRTHYNVNWKRDATARLANITGNVGDEYLLQQCRAVKSLADTLFDKNVERVLLLQALTEELMPETRELVRRCTSFEDLLRCMLDAAE